MQDRPNIEYKIKVIDDPKQINAFAVPGGSLYIHSGLLLIAGDETEIAGILAHEISHIVGHHSANQLAAQFGMDLLVDITLGKDPLQLGQIPGQLSGERIKHIENLMLKYVVEGDERHRKRFLQATADLRRAHSSANSGYGRK